MTKFQKNPEYIDGFQMTTEALTNTKSWSEWAIEASTKDPRQIDSIYPTTPKQPENGMTLRNMYGEFPIPINHWVVKSEQGTTMIIADKHFTASYTEIAKEEEGEESKTVTSLASKTIGQQKKETINAKITTT